MNSLLMTQKKLGAERSAYYLLYIPSLWKKTDPNNHVTHTGIDIESFVYRVCDQSQGVGSISHGRAAARADSRPVII